MSESMRERERDRESYTTGTMFGPLPLISKAVSVFLHRACCPLATVLIDWLFLGRQFPSVRTILSLLGIVVGVYNYVILDGEFKMNGVTAYFWVGCWYALICFQMCYGKALQTGVSLEKWGSVYYQNLISIPIMAAFGLTLGDFDKLETAVIGENAPLWILLSSVFGIAIGFASWGARQSISSTSYTLVGVINKMVSILWSILYIDPNYDVVNIVVFDVIMMDDG